MCESYAGLESAQWYYGAWDCYPYQDSGLVYVSDTRGGLFILEIEKGHFLRSQDAFPLSTWRTPPNLHPHGATPKQNATGFQFRVTGVTALAAYQILIGTQTSSVPVGPIKRYVEINHPNTVILTGFAAPSGDTLHAWTPQSPQPGQTLYAQIIELGGTPAVPVAASRQIRFKLL